MKKLWFSALLMGMVVIGFIAHAFDMIMRYIESDGSLARQGLILALSI